MKLMADMVLMPSFPENEVALYKQNTLQGLNRTARKSGISGFGTDGAKIIYGTSSVCDDFAVSERRCRTRSTRENLMKFHDARFIPNNAVMIIVGNVKRDDDLETD